MKRYDYKTTDKPGRAADHWVEKWVCGLSQKGLRIAASLWQLLPRVHNTNARSGQINY